MARPHRPTTPHHHRTSQFFKIYTPTISQDQLRVPPEFMKRIKNRSLGVVYLMGPSGNAWRVSLIKGFFRSGWKGFASDHRLEHGDFLVFRYDGDACFTVRVFDGTGCEKEACFHAKPVDGEEAEGGELVLCGTPDGKKRRLENGLVVWRGSDEEMVGLEGEVDVKPLSLTYSNCSSVSPNVRRGTYVFSSELRKSCIVKSEALDAPASAPARIALKAKTNLGCEVIRRRRRVQTERGIYHIDSYEARHGQLRQGALLSQRRVVTQEEKERALEAAKSFKSSNPFTLVVMRDAYVYSGFFMYLPAAFVIDHLPKINSNLTLWDPDGKPWTVRLVLGKGRGGLSAGWAKFSRVHNLERDDICILELIRNKELQVHIFRVVEEILPLIHSSECFKKSELRLIM